MVFISMLVIALLLQNDTKRCAQRKGLLNVLMELMCSLC